MQYMKDIYFEVQSVLGKKIRTTKTYWDFIIQYKHPIIKKFENQVKETLKNADEVRRSKIDISAYLYYKKYDTHYICVLAKHTNNDGFIITAYLADKIKKGDIIWKKKS